MQPQARKHCVVSLLEEQARTIAERPYFTCEGATITYGQLWQRAGAAAAWLAGKGIGPGDLVSGLSYNSIDYLVLLHGCLRLGAVFAPLNQALQKDDMAQTLVRIKPKVMVASAEMRRQLDAASIGGLPILALEDCANAPGTDDPPTHRWKAGEWSWVLFSGATTGLPKGIMLPHAFALAHGYRARDTLHLTAEDRWLSNLQMCHAWLNFVVLCSCMLAGAQAEATRWFSASRWLDQVHGFGATIVDPYLPMASALVAQPPSPRDRTHKVRAGLGPWGAVGEWDRRVAFEERFGIPTFNVFGITEAGGLLTAESVDEPRRPRSVGKVTGDFEIVVADEEGNILPAGQEGEVLYRPNRPGIMSLGYLGDAERTLATWRDLWIHSADIGYYDEDGYLYFVGRMPHWLRRKGENVSAREVEMALRNLPGVADAAVLAVPSKLGDDDIKALVVPAVGVALEPARIHAALLERLSFFKVPRFIDIVDSFPRTMKAEPDRKLLQPYGKLSGSEWDSEAQQAGRGRRA